jgi:hypothetical protein
MNCITPRERDELDNEDFVCQSEHDEGFCHTAFLASDLFLSLDSEILHQVFAIRKKHFTVIQSQGKEY